MLLTFITNSTIWRWSYHTFHLIPLHIYLCQDLVFIVIYYTSITLLILIKCPKPYITKATLLEDFIKVISFIILRNVHSNIQVEIEDDRILLFVCHTSRTLTNTYSCRPCLSLFIVYSMIKELLMALCIVTEFLDSH